MYNGSVATVEVSIKLFDVCKLRFSMPGAVVPSGAGVGLWFQGRNRYLFILTSSFVWVVRKKER